MSGAKRKKKKLFPRLKAHPEQAGFFRRFTAFAVDWMIIVLIFAGFSHIEEAMGGKPGLFTQLAHMTKSGKSIHLSLESEKEHEKELREEYLNILQKVLPEEDYKTAKITTTDRLEEIYGNILEEQSEDQAIRIG